ncbi:MAG: CHRD domain-containing protein [Vicinamibacterales bacterium]|jgi:hypothetical protein
MRRAAIFAVLLAATFGGACSDDSDLTYFDAALSPDNEVPARASGASGVARMTFDGTTVTYIAIASNLNNYTQGHIHSGAAGVNGPVRVFLLQFQNPALSITQGTITEGSFTAADMQGGFDFNTLIEEMRAGTAYVNFHSTTYPGGEIRGQVRLLN